MDVCCLKRPFDDQSQARVRLETEAILTILSIPASVVQFLRSPAHDLENDQNPVPWRAGLVRQWLGERPMENPPAEALTERTRALMAQGFANFDALHLAVADLSAADVFVTTDDGLLTRAQRGVALRVTDPVTLARELAQ